MTSPLLLQRLKRKPVRITITISALLYERLVQRSLEEGRSLSNLAAYVMELGCSRFPGSAGFS